MSRREKVVLANMVLLPLLVLLGSIAYVAVDVSAQSTIVRGKAEQKPSAQVQAGTYDIRLGAGTWTGTASVLITVTASNTTVSVDPTQPIYIGSPIPPGPVPPGPVPPTDPKLSAFQQSLKQIQVPGSGFGDRAAMAKLYRDTAALQLSGDQLRTVTDSLYGPVADATTDPTGWKAFKTRVDAAVSAAGLSTHAELVAAWGLVAEYVD